MWCGRYQSASHDLPGFTLPTWVIAAADCANLRLASPAAAGMADIGSWPETMRPTATACCIPRETKSALRTFASLDATASTTTRSLISVTKGSLDLNDSAEEPPFLFLIGANNAFDSNTKVAIEKYSSTLILTREK